MLGRDTESVFDKVLLLGRVLCSGLGQVDEASFTMISLVSKQKDVGTAYDDPALFPHFGLVLKNVQVAFFADEWAESNFLHVRHQDGPFLAVARAGRVAGGWRSDEGADKAWQIV